MGQNFSFHSIELQTVTWYLREELFLQVFFFIPFLLFFHVFLRENIKNVIWYFCLKRTGLSAFNVAF